MEEVFQRQPINGKCPSTISDLRKNCNLQLCLNQVQLPTAAAAAVTTTAAATTATTIPRYKT